MTITRTPQGSALQFASATVELTANGLTVNDYVIENPGEYDVAGIGFEVGEGYALVYADSLRVLVIEPAHPKLSAESVTALEDIQLVVVPADASAEQQKAVANLIHNLEPRGIVVVGSVDEAKLITGQTVEAQLKVKIQASDLETEEMRVWTVA